MEGDYKSPFQCQRITNPLELGLQGEVSQKLIDLRDMPSGVYTYSVQCGQYQRTGKIIIVK